MALLVFVTTIIVEVAKNLFPKVPTNIVAVVVSLIVTILAVVILCAALKITIMWYYTVGAVVLGIFVAYASMFGFDKFKVTKDADTYPGIGVFATPGIRKSKRGSCPSLRNQLDKLADNSFPVNDVSWIYCNPENVVL